MKGDSNDSNDSIFSKVMEGNQSTLDDSTPEPLPVAIILWVVINKFIRDDKAESETSISLGQHPEFLEETERSKQ